MWIFAKDGFLSIVEDRGHPGCLLVRARIKGDIEHFFPDAKVERTEHRDYLYRTSIPTFDVATLVGFKIMAIDYDNFKENITDKRRNLFYNDVWNAMIYMQKSLDG